MIEAKTRLYISKNIRFSFSNSDNLKYDIKALMVNELMLAINQLSKFLTG